MKHLKAKKTFGQYKTVTMKKIDLLPASVYENIPDFDKLEPEIKAGNLEYPLLVFQTNQDYWTKNHLGLYRAGSPTLPTHAPEIDAEVVVKGNTITEKRIHIIWSGRQRFQIAKDLGYTDIDVIIEPVFHKVVNAASKFRKI